MALAPAAVATAMLTSLHPSSLLHAPPNISSFSSNLPLSRPKTYLSSYRNSSTPGPQTECPVPLDQQPVNEYQSLSTSLPFSWAAGDVQLYSSRLLFIGASFSHFVGLPVAAFGKGTTVDPQVAIVAVSSGILLVTLAVLRMYLGWAYVGNRLLSATVEYEETGWYDGQIWVKTPEVLARDRLLGSFSVKPVLTRVKLTLVGLAVSLVACTILFINVEGPKKIVASEFSSGGTTDLGEDQHDIDERAEINMRATLTDVDLKAWLKRIIRRPKR